MLTLKEQLSIWMRSSTNNTQGHKSQVTGRKLIVFSACGLWLLACSLGFSGRQKPQVYIKSFKGSRYQLMVNGQPYIVKGVCYNPIPIGENHDYDWWSDPYKPWMVDGKLMKEMGINTVRIYQPGENPEAVKRVIKDLYEQFGIRTILGHWMGFWEYPCPLYGDKAFEERIKKEVSDMVNLYKDCPGILMWILGNENNYSCLGHVNPWSTDEIDKEPDPQKRQNMRAKVYYSFINDITKQIHKLDPNHPVALGNGELIMLDQAKLYCQDVDLVACIIYRGRSFGNIFKSLKNTFDKPLLFSEFGADAYDSLKKTEAQDWQALFLESQWRQIYDNLASSQQGEGNCIGGTMFEWSDEWWKHNPMDAESLKVHDTESNWSNPSYYFDIQAPKNMNMNEEWFGIVSLSGTEKEAGLDKRIPRKAYYVIRDFWKNPVPKPKTEKKK